MFFTNKATKMTELNSYIGQYLITVNFGIGEISNIVEIDDGQFFKVTFPQSNNINYFSINNSSTYRHLSDKTEILKAIETFKKKHQDTEFNSTQEKINFYKSTFKAQDIQTIAKHLSILNQEEEIHTSILKIFEKTLDSFVLEIQFVLGIKNEEAWELIGLSQEKIK
jgi:RNA polymerase-interacting CarD/CdnL/TRCF family regulator